MAEVLVQISGVLYDKLSRTERPVLLQGAASLLGLGVGGGPIEGGPGDPPLGIWGPTDPRPGWGLPPVRPPGSIWPDPGRPHPEHPIAPGGPPPGIWPGPGPLPGIEHPIVIPPPQVPPEYQPPQPPPPGSTAPVPPPPGSGGWPTTGIVPPPYVVMNYPGVGLIYVAPPPHAEPA